MYSHGYRGKAYCLPRGNIERIRGGVDIERTSVTIIGAGPAGLSAAVQLRKEGIPAVVFEKGVPGGLIRYARRVDNILGSVSMSGKEMAARMVEHAVGMGVEIRNEMALSLNIVSGEFVLSTDNGITGSKYLILATGSVPRKLDLPGAIYRIEPDTDMGGRRILVIGGGDLALDNALRMQDQGSDVTVLHRSRLKANRMLIEEAMSSGIKFSEGFASDVYRKDGKYYLKGHGIHDVAAVFIGRSPDRTILGGMEGLEMSYMSHSTSVKGLYLIGDAASVEYSQAVYAMASGTSCAMDIAGKVREDEGGPGERRR